MSPYGTNLYFSQVIRIDRSSTQLQALSLVVGLVVLRTLRQLGVREVGLKWPNDLLASGKKIAGILLELNGDPADICHVVIGIGINANMLHEEGIDQAWTSMQREIGRSVDRNELAIVLAEQLEQALTMHREQGFAAFHQEWERYHLWQGREVRLISGVHEVAGTALGVSGDGGLRLLVEGAEQVYSGGELSGNTRIMWRVLPADGADPVLEGAAETAAELRAQLDTLDGAPLRWCRIVSVRSDEETRQLLGEVSRGGELRILQASAAVQCAGVRNGYREYARL